MSIARCRCGLRLCFFLTEHCINMGSGLYCRPRAWAFFAAACLYGCGTTPVPYFSSKEMESLTTAQRVRLSAMKVYMSYEEPPDRPYKVIARVRGISCVLNRKAYQQATDEEATHVLKVRAALLNADAVINADCNASSGTDWVNNCWSSVVCVGDAIQGQSTPGAVAPFEATVTLSRAIAVVPSTAAPSEGLEVLLQRMVSGAANTVSENRPRAAAVPLRYTLSPMRVHLPVAEAMVTAAEVQREARVELPVPLLGTLCPSYPIAKKKQIASNLTTATSSEFESESRLKTQGYTQCAEVGITHLRWDEYRDQGRSYTVLLATARARVQDLLSENALVTRDYWYQSSPLESSQSLQSRLQRAQGVLGERMAEDLVINAIGDGVIEKGVCGLTPAQSGFRESGAEASGQLPTNIGGQAPATSLNPQEPVLAWESFPTSRHMAILAREAEGSVTDVIYDLRIWRDGQAGYTYERLGLSANVHRIDSALPAGEYRWSIRARFVFAGKARATTWNYSWQAALTDATAHVKPPKGGWVTCRRDYISDNSSFRLIVPSP